MRGSGRHLEWAVSGLKSGQRALHITSCGLERSVSHQGACRFPAEEVLSMVVALCCKYHSRNHQKKTRWLM